MQLGVKQNEKQLWCKSHNEPLGCVLLPQSIRLYIKIPKTIKSTWNARRNGKIMTLVRIADGSDVAKSIKPIAVTRVKRPDNHLGNIVVLKIPMPHIVTPKMVDE